MRAGELGEEHIGAGFWAGDAMSSGVIGDVEIGGPFVPPAPGMPPIPETLTVHVVLRPLRPGGPSWHVWIRPDAPVTVSP